MLHNLNILLIEDSPDLRKNIAAVLHMHHARVALAPDGHSGLKMALEDPPDMIITDLEMPQFDGLWLINALKTHPRTTHVPIMAMSGDVISLMQCPEGCIRIGKPFRVERFVQLIVEATQQHNNDDPDPAYQA